MINNSLIEQIYNDKKMNSLYDNFSFTPMMLEWKNTKEDLIKKYGKNTILFFQVGTFYETYFHDAVIVSRLLGFTLTKKDKKKKDSVVMAGMPLVANMDKLSKLLEKDLNIVFVSEFPDNSTKTGIIRKINKIITPSTNLDYLNKENNYLLSIYEGYSSIGFTLLDIGTGDFKFLNVKKDNLEMLDILYKYNVTEVIINKEPSSIIKDLLLKLGIVFYNIQNEHRNHIGLIEFQFGTLIEDLEIYSEEESIIACSNALYYAKQITNSELEYITEISDISDNKNIHLDKTTITNLELVKTYSGGIKNSLYGIVNNTITPFGSRQLRKDILSPFLEKQKIENRLKQVEYLYNNIEKNTKIRNALGIFHDIEKLSAKLGNNSINPIDLINLSNSLGGIEILKNINISNNLLNQLINSIYDYKDFIKKIDEALIENPNINIREGNIFKDGYNKNLDEERNIYFNIKDVLKEKENILKEKCGINTLKIINNNQGFFIEVRNSELKNIPDEWIYIKKLNNVTRYTTSDIKTLDEKYKLSEIKIKEIEYNLFQSLRIELSKYIINIFNDAKKISEIDIISTFAYNSKIYNYNKPIIGETLNIKNGRHPIVELISGSFISNDTYITKKNIKLITGPNMGGKSTYLKQNALIYILFHIGSFIPADKNSTLPLIDGVYTRIGASDNIEEGLSTFAMEMTEMGYICNKYNKKSLVLIDEIGRGTDSKNGLALAQSFLEYFINKNKGFIFFSTHYSDLVHLTKSNKNTEALKAIVEFTKDNNIQFLHKIVPGIEDNSYGIEIAELYNIPSSIINKAKEIRQKEKR